MACRKKYPIDRLISLHFAWFLRRLFQAPGHNFFFTPPFTGLEGLQQRSQLTINKTPLLISASPVAFLVKYLNTQEFKLFLNTHTSN
jgi:hypothetical protein